MELEKMEKIAENWSPDRRSPKKEARISSSKPDSKKIMNEKGIRGTEISKSMHIEYKRDYCRGCTMRVHVEAQLTNRLCRICFIKN